MYLPEHLDRWKYLIVYRKSDKCRELWNRDSFEILNVPSIAEVNYIRNQYQA